MFESGSIMRMDYFTESGGQRDQQQGMYELVSSWYWGSNANNKYCAILTTYQWLDTWEFPGLRIVFCNGITGQEFLLKWQTTADRVRYVRRVTQSDPLRLKWFPCQGLSSRFSAWQWMLLGHYPIPRGETDLF